MPDSERSISEVDALLLSQILAGQEDGWRSVVAKFQPRLIAFATNQLGREAASASAEDLVQETFVSFLKSVKTFRSDCSLETFLFRILRWRINDHFRKRGSKVSASVCRNVSEMEVLTGNDLSASHYVVRQERLSHDHRQLSNAIFQLTYELKQRAKFRDLQIAEGLFFAHLRNKQIAGLLSISENEVAVVKHRLIERLRTQVAQSSGQPNAAADETLLLPDLQSIWVDLRPSCPKRTTLGKYVLEILPDDWTRFVRFHVEALGCVFCQANLDELTKEVQSSASSGEALFQSTIGFLPGRID